MTDEKNKDGLLEGFVDDLSGRDQFKRSKFGWFTGAGAARDVASQAKSAFTDSGGRTKTLFKAASSSSRRGVAVDPSVVGDRERFLASMQANRRTEANVAHAVATTYRQFWAYCALMVAAVLIAVFWMVHSGFFLAEWIRPVEVLARMFPVPALGALALRAGYTNWMMRTMRLSTLRNYLRSGAIAPRRSMEASTVGGATRSVALRAIALVLALGAFASVAGPSTALAQAQAVQSSESTVSQLFDFQHPDLFLTMLGYVMPDVGPVPTSEVADSQQFLAIKNGFFAFSSMLMFIGMLIFGWQLVSSVVASAKEGSLLGRQYHEVWAPVRLVTGFGMLAPMAGGLCAAQIVVLYLVAFGSNLANAVWVPYVQGVTALNTDTNGARLNTTVNTLTSWNMPASSQAVQQIFLRELCNETLKAYAIRSRSTDSELPDTGFSQNTEFKEVGKDLLGWWQDNLLANYTYVKADYGPVCGSIATKWENEGLYQKASWVLTKFNFAPPLPYGINQEGWKEIESNSTRNMAEYNADAEMAKAQIDGMKLVQQRVQGLAKEIASTYQSGDASAAHVLGGKLANKDLQERLVKELKIARQEYLTSMNQAARRVYNFYNDWAIDKTGGKGKLSVMEETAKQHGWASAGTLYMTIARVNNRMYERANRSAAYQDPDFSNLEGNPDLVKIMEGDDITPGIFKDAHSFFLQNSKQIFGRISKEGVIAANDEQSTLGGQLTQFFGEGATFWESDWDPNPLNPMDDMIQLGNKMFNWGFVVYGVSMGADMGSSAISTFAGGVASKGMGVAGAAGGVTKVFAGALSGLASLGSFIGIALMGAGLIHTFVLPMIPYILTTFFVASMLLLTVEALVAAPIWAFMHIRMDGDEFVSSVQRPGYMIAFNLVLRPTLMLFGLMCSYVVFSAMAYFVRITFEPAMQGLGGSTSIGLFGMIIMILMVTYLHFILATRAFQLITKLPDRVTRWAGQGGEQLGEESDESNVTGFVGGYAKKVDNALLPMTLMKGSPDTKGIKKNSKRIAEKLEGGGGGGPSDSPSTGIGS